MKNRKKDIAYFIIFFFLIGMMSWLSIELYEAGYAIGHKDGFNSICTYENCYNKCFSQQIINTKSNYNPSEFNAPHSRPS